MNAGADPNVRNRIGNTPLSAAIALGSPLSLIRVLLEVGADANTEDGKGDTPLLNHVESHFTDRFDAADVVRTLVNAGADPNVQNRIGNTPLHLAIMYGRTLSYIRVLLEVGADANTEDGKGDTPLLNHVESHFTDRFDAADVVRTLVNAGADPNEQDRSSRTPLHLAIMYARSLSYIRVLLEVGADVNTEDANGDTPLLYHVSNRNTAGRRDAADVVMTLVNAGADPNEQDRSGRTPLHLAIIYDRTLNYIRVLLEVGADVNTKDANGDTPLLNHVGSSYTHQPHAVNIVEAFGQAGADPSIRNARGETPLQMARRLQRHDSYIQALIDIGATELIPGVRLSASGLIIDEGGSGTYTVVLESSPGGGEVTVTPVSDDPDVTVSPASLGFDADNWDTPQTVTVSAAQDADSSDESATVTHAVAGYGDLTEGGAVSVTVSDDDASGVRLSASGLIIDEGGSGIYTVVLESSPGGGEVTITPVSDDPDVTVSPASLGFDADNWDTPQTVTVSAAQDADSSDESATVTHAVAGYGDLTEGGAVSVTVSDDDASGVRLSASGLIIDEGGSGTYTVVLESSPGGGEVTVTPVSDDPDVTVSPASLGFDADNWDTPQTVTVSAAHDADSSDKSVSVTHTVAGYGDLTEGGAVSVTVSDDDASGVRLSASGLIIDEGGSGTYTVVLESSPGGGEVTVTPVSDDPDVTVSPASLGFDADNWDTPQTVTVSAAQDADSSDKSVSVTHAVAGYGDLIEGGTVSVTVSDDDASGVRLSASGLIIDEGGSGTYTVVLESSPGGGEVTVTPVSDDPDVTVSPASLGFDADNWDTPQTVTVSAAQDADSSDESATVTHAVAGYGDLTEGGAVSVTVIESTTTPPPVEEVERGAVTDTLAAVTASTVSNVTTNIGARFSAARGGTSVFVAGLSAAQFSALEDISLSRDSLWSGEGYSRALTSDDLLRSTDFQIVLGASESTHAQESEGWTFWGRGDLQYFSSDPDQGFSYDGGLTAGYLGLDKQIDDDWLAGVAVSRTAAKAAYALGTGGAGNDGRMDVTLNSLLPYIRYAPDSQSDRGSGRFSGAGGQGRIENDSSWRGIRSPERSGASHVDGFRRQASRDCDCRSLGLGIAWRRRFRARIDRGRRGGDCRTHGRYVEGTTGP